jgi:hypothetical protein
MKPVISLVDIVAALDQYATRYRWIDVRIADVAELQDPATTGAFQPSGPRQWTTQVRGRTLNLEIFPDLGVARFGAGGPNAPAADQGAGMIGGAALGAVLGAALSSRRDVQTGAVLGLLIGGLMGAAAEKGPDDSRVMTIRFDAPAGRWRVYQGPYHAWAKQALWAPAPRPGRRDPAPG